MTASKSFFRKVTAIAGAALILSILFVTIARATQNISSQQANSYNGFAGMPGNTGTYIDRPRYRHVGYVAKVAKTVKTAKISNSAAVVLKDKESDLISAAVALLKHAVYDFHTDPSMNIEETQSPHLKVSTTRTIDQLVRESGYKEGHTTGSIKISNYVEAKLVGVDFDIKPITAERQTVTSQKDMLWQWQIKPLKEGDLKLYVTLNSLLSLPGKEPFLPITSVHRVISVKVNLTQSVTKKATWANAHIGLITFCVGLLGVIALLAIALFIPSFREKIKDKIIDKIMAWL